MIFPNAQVYILKIFISIVESIIFIFTFRQVLDRANFSFENNII